MPARDPRSSGLYFSKEEMGSVTLLYYDWERGISGSGGRLRPVSAVSPGRLADARSPRVRAIFLDGLG